MAKALPRELQTKLAKLRAAMAVEGVGLLRFRGVDSFSWLMCGASNALLLSREDGVAEALVTQDQLLVLTDNIEVDRLQSEEIPWEGVEIRSVPWIRREEHSESVKSLCVTGKIASDRPRSTESSLPAAILQLRFSLEPEEVERYRVLGRDAAQAMTDSLAQAESAMSELELAAVGMRELKRRGIDPALILVAGEKRLKTVPHPLPTSAALGQRCMMVFCGRRHGLYANLSRILSFRNLSTHERDSYLALAQIEAVAFAESRSNKLLSEIYETLRRAYSESGHGQDFERLHLGGLSGYQSREAFATPSSAQRIPQRSVLAWNPSFSGWKMEDTVFLNERDEIEILTTDPRWPTIEVAGRKRPNVRVKS